MQRSEQQMPARIWADMNMGLWLGGPQPDRRPRPPIEFIRADIAERMAVALEAILYEDSDKNEVDCIKDRVAAVAALSAFRSATQDTEARHD